MFIFILVVLMFCLMLASAQVEREEDYAVKDVLIVTVLLISTAIICTSMEMANATKNKPTVEAPLEVKK